MMKLKEIYKKFNETEGNKLTEEGRSIINTKVFDKILDYAESKKITLNLGFDSLGNIATIHLIKVPKELWFRGEARKIFRMLTVVADKNNITLTLSPDDRFGTNLRRLVNFYKSFGFVDSNYQYTESMFRKPRKMFKR